MEQNKLEKQFKIYSDLARKDKNIDVASLMAAALEKPETSSLSIGQKRAAYFVSIGFPPFGLIYAVKFWFSDKDDARDAAWLCIVLTFVSITLLVVLAQVMLSGSGIGESQLNQIQNLSPEQIREMYQ